MEQSLAPTLVGLSQYWGLMSITVDLSPGYFSGSDANYQLVLLPEASHPAPPHSRPEGTLHNCPLSLKGTWANPSHESALQSGGVITQEDVAS